ncbi:MAG: hypothetical protein BroJett011_62850 [Chloroflexota bacterium]|nr:MAG: hypothetical protein BroJett011_62850 [Chloroflexota bacterium]
MAERVQVYDLAGVPVIDPEEAIKYATGINFETRWPQGYAVCTFKVRRSDVFADWAIREAYGVKVFDGATIIYQGRIETLSRSAGGADEYITVECVGWYVVLAERTVQKRWIDHAATKFVDWPANLENDHIQNTWIYNKTDNRIQVFAGSGDILRNDGDSFQLRYDLHHGGVIRRVRCNYIARTGEVINFQFRNTDNDAHEAGKTATGGAVMKGTINALFSHGDTRGMMLRWVAKRRDLYDQNDFFHIMNLRVEAAYETGHRTAAPTYTQGQIVEDILLLAAQKGQQFSVDFGQLGDPGQILDPFTIEEPEYAGPAIDKIAAYGDTNLNTWGLAVWDGNDTSDGLPRVVFEARSIADYEYEASLADLTTGRLTYARISEKLRNSVILGYEDAKGMVRYRTPADSAALADAASIAAEYQRDEYIRLGQGDTSRADMVGGRFIAYHKDRLTRATLVKKGWIKNKGGGITPANRVRAGQRVKLIETGEILFIRQTFYDAESQTVTISPDAAEDNISMLFLQRERGLGKLA